MRYVGGKYRMAKRIREAILEARGIRTSYVEPFIGGAAVFSKVASSFTEARAYDAHPDLVLMWQAVADGWLPPDDLSESEYRQLRTAEPSALRGFAGFACSYGARWFAGFTPEDPLTTRAGVPLHGSRSEAVKMARQAITMRGVSIQQADYRQVVITASDVVYADPPYSQTTAYAGVPPFDSHAFWATAQGWADTGAAVLVSESTAPLSWVPVIAHRLPTYLGVNDGQYVAAHRAENLYADPATAEHMVRNGWAFPKPLPLAA